MLLQSVQTHATQHGNGNQVTTGSNVELDSALEDEGTLLHSVEMLGTTTPLTQWRIPGDLNPQLYCCGNLKSHSLHY
jgi:hypothetical protein